MQKHFPRLLLIDTTKPDGIKYSECINDMAGDLDDIDGFAVVTGGEGASWTGSRVGVVAAKAFAMSTGKPVYEVREVTARELAPKYDAEFKITPKNTVQTYFEKTIYPFYFDKIGTLYANHAKRVIEKSLQFAKQVKEPINTDMVFAVAAFHDIGLVKGKKDHEKTSAKMFLDDKEVTKFFTKDQMQIIAQAIEDHRASLDRDPRTIYGKIVSTADRLGWLDVDEAFRVWYANRLRDKPHMTLDEMIEDARQHVLEKFGKDGYVDGKLYFETKEFDEFRKIVSALATDPKKFKQKFLQMNGVVCKK